MQIPKQNLLNDNSASSHHTSNILLESFGKHNNLIQNWSVNII